MRIAYLCNEKSHHFKRWYEYFLQRGHTVHVISGDTRLNNQSVSLPRGVEVSYLPERKYREPRISFVLNLIRVPMIVKKLKSILHYIKPDILHAHSILYGYWGALTNFHPFIVTPYGTDALVTTRKYRIYRRIAKGYIRRQTLLHRIRWSVGKLVLN